MKRTLHLRSFPVLLITRLKVMAAQEGVPLTALVPELLTEALKARKNGKERYP